MSGDHILLLVVYVVCGSGADTVDSYLVFIVGSLYTPTSLIRRLVIPYGPRLDTTYIHPVPNYNLYIYIYKKYGNIYHTHIYIYTKGATSIEKDTHTPRPESAPMSMLHVRHLCEGRVVDTPFFVRAIDALFEEAYSTPRRGAYRDLVLAACIYTVFKWYKVCVSITRIQEHFGIKRGFAIVREAARVHSLFREHHFPTMGVPLHSDTHLQHMARELGVDDRGTLDTLDELRRRVRVDTHRPTSVDAAFLLVAGFDLRRLADVTPCSRHSIQRAAATVHRVCGRQTLREIQHAMAPYEERESPIYPGERDRTRNRTQPTRDVRARTDSRACQVYTTLQEEHV